MALIWLCGHSFQGDSIDKVFFNFQIADWKSLHTHFCWRHYENTLNTQLWPIWVPRSALYDVCNLWPVTQLCRTPVFSSMNRSDITYSPGCCEITVGFMHVKHLEWCLTWHKHSVCTLSSFFHSHSWFQGSKSVLLGVMGIKKTTLFRCKVVAILERLPLSSPRSSTKSQWISYPLQELRFLC